MSNKYFGTDGIRGVFGKDLTPELALRTGRAIVRYFGEGEYCVCRDSRVSGEVIEQALVMGIRTEGGEPISIGLLPTPACAYFTKLLGARAGVVISASHNPPEYNGIKIFCSTGLKASEQKEAEIETIMDGMRDREGFAYDTAVLADARLSYTDYLVRSAGHRLDGIRVRLDCCYGACAKVAPAAFEALGAIVTAYNNEYIGSKINVDVGALHPEFLLSKLKEGEIGFAFDGDGDRLCVMTDGHVIDGDTILYYLSKSMPLNRNTVVGTVLNNLALEEALRADGVDFVRTPVGDKYISNTMYENGYSLGGEQSGHYIINTYVPTGDAILSALYLLGILLDDRGRLKHVEPLPLVPQKAISVHADRSVVKSDEMHALVRAAKADLGADGRVIVRMSGTEPKVRVMVECRDANKTDRWIAEFGRFLAEREPAPEPET